MSQFKQPYEIITYLLFFFNIAHIKYADDTWNY